VEKQDEVENFVTTL